MHRHVLAFSLWILAFATAHAVSIETAYTRYYDAGEIRPIGQYFGASLRGQGFRTVIASDPGDPAGQYFITKLEKVKSSALTSARMTYYRSDSKDTTTVSWDLSGASVKKWLYLGLTGNDWPGKDISPLAWRIELLDANGTLLAEWKSFLWEMP